MEIFNVVNKMYALLFELINKVLVIAGLEKYVLDVHYGFDPETGKFGKLEDIVD